MPATKGMTEFLIQLYIAKVPSLRRGQANVHLLRLPSASETAYKAVRATKL